MRKMQKPIFSEEWYNALIQKSDEKRAILGRVKELAREKFGGSCLEIGLGTAPYFATELAQNFEKYVIVERRDVNIELPHRAELVNGDWETVDPGSFDVIIASHVIYYFRNKIAGVEKIFNALHDGGKAFFVVNGKDADYGLLKEAFAKMIGEPYSFTYDELRELLGARRFEEHTLSSVIRYDSYEGLYDSLRISFDHYPREYCKLRDEILDYFEKSLGGRPFVINQKIFEVRK